MYSSLFSSVTLMFDPLGFNSCEVIFPNNSMSTANSMSKPHSSILLSLSKNNLNSLTFCLWCQQAPLYKMSPLVSAFINFALQKINQHPKEEETNRQPRKILWLKSRSRVQVQTYKRTPCSHRKQRFGISKKTIENYSAFSIQQYKGVVSFVCTCKSFNRLKRL